MSDCIERCPICRQIGHPAFKPLKNILAVLACSATGELAGVQRVDNACHLPTSEILLHTILSKDILFVQSNFGVPLLTALNMK